MIMSGDLVSSGRIIRNRRSSRDTAYCGVNRADAYPAAGKTQRTLRPLQLMNSSIEIRQRAARVRSRMERGEFLPQDIDKLAGPRPQHDAARTGRDSFALHLPTPSVC